MTVVLVVNTVGAALLAVSLTVVLYAWKVVFLALYHSFQCFAIVEALIYSVQRRIPLMRGQQWGGGGDGQGDAEDAGTDVQATAIAGVLRRLGEAVNTPGIKAIKGVLLALNGLPQSTAASRSGSTTKSIRKYYPLVQKAMPLCVGAGFVVSAAIAGPCVTGVLCGSLAAVALPPVVKKALPNVSNISLVSETFTNGCTYRVWRASVKEFDGTVQERETKPILHEPEPPDETPDARKQREDREHKRIVRALRALDAEALAAHRLKDRERKRKQTAHRAAELPALPVPDGDAAWFLPPMDQPHFIGEYVWLTRDGEVKFASI